VRREFYMQWVPTSQILKEMYIEDAKEEGREEGREEGKIEGKFEIARSMLADGLPVEIIRKYTGLDESSILSLK
jgi:predicted transposase/invertase (TIGR01784 family)